jgi:hypothetical protein
MKLYQYDDIKKLNQALGSFAKNGVKVEKVETLTVGDKLQHFVLADPKELPKQPKVESKTEVEAKKTIKEKKEKKSEVKAEVSAEAKA